MSTQFANILTSDAIVHHKGLCSAKLNIYAVRPLSTRPILAFAILRGVIVSYFEWVQDHSSFFWRESEVREKLDHMMVKAFDAVWAAHLEHKVSLRSAAYILGCRRVLEAREQRGLYP